MGNVTHKTREQRDYSQGETLRRTRRLLFAEGAFCCILAALTVFFAGSAYKSSPDEKRLRVDFNALVNRAESGTIDANVSANFALFDTGGRVLVSTIPEYPVGNMVDLHTLSGLSGTKDNGKTVDFVSPVIQNGKLGGLLLVKAEKSAYGESSPLGFILIFAVLLLTAGSLLLLYRTQRLIKKDLLAPLSKLHDATRSLLNGDFSSRLLYDDSNEAGILCHDFEAMRDELASAFRRESDMLEKDRVLYACVSHDLKTPLAAISGYAEEIRDGIADSPDRIHELSTLMLKKVRLLTKLIDDILEETKAQLGELSIVTEELYAPSFFEEVCGELSLDAARAGLSFQTDTVPNVLLSIDRKRIMQVMQNLISNSIKYTPAGGTISVRYAVDGRELVIGVKDNGCGIAAGDIPYIFDRFYRGDSARSQNIPGSGLGLCISKDIVERHGGRIECDSVLGVGTEVCFSLPL